MQTEKQGVRFWKTKGEAKRASVQRHARIAVEPGIASYSEWEKNSDTWKTR